MRNLHTLATRYRHIPTEMKRYIAFHADLGARLRVRRIRNGEYRLDRWVEGWTGRNQFQVNYEWMHWGFNRTPAQLAGLTRHYRETMVEWGEGT
jgi:hypothetical protein